MLITSNHSISTPSLKSKYFNGHESYVFNCKLTDLLSVPDRAGSISIKEQSGNNYLSGVGFKQVLHYQRLLTEQGLSPGQVEEKKKGLFGNFNPEAPLEIILDFPCKGKIIFNLLPYPHQITRWLTLHYFPSGYVAWSIAQKYAQLFKRPFFDKLQQQNLESLYLYGFELIESKKVVVRVGSL